MDVNGKRIKLSVCSSGVFFSLHLCYYFLGSIKNMMIRNSKSLINEAFSLICSSNILGIVESTQLVKPNNKKIIDCLLRINC